MTYLFYEKGNDLERCKITILHYQTPPIEMLETMDYLVVEDKDVPLPHDNQHRVGICYYNSVSDTVFAEYEDSVLSIEIKEAIDTYTLELIEGGLL